jgi:hypothetical protein
MEFRAERQSAPVKAWWPAAEAAPAGRRKERMGALQVLKMELRSVRKMAARRLA